MVQPDDGYQLRTPHQEEETYNYLDDSLLQSHIKAEMFTSIHEYHQLLRNGGLKAAPDKTHFFLRKVKFLGHVISEQGIHSVAKRVQDLQNLKSPQSKTDVMKVLGCLGKLLYKELPRRQPTFQQVDQRYNSFQMDR